MFGYIIINKGEMKFREFDVYHSYYCGLCEALKKNHGLRSQFTLTYDMTFLTMLLSSLYEPDTKEYDTKCVAHPLEKHKVRYNEFSEYAADMNVMFAYFNCRDDWEDDRKVSRLMYSELLKCDFNRILRKHGDKAAHIRNLMERISEGERIKSQDIDYMSGLFGEVLGEIMAVRHDEWEDELRALGMQLGKFIYLLDAYEDVEEDIKNSRYNPLIQKFNDPDFDDETKTILTMIMAECCKEFEKLPILDNVDILRNILYSGVWYRFDATYKARTKELGIDS